MRAALLLVLAFAGSAAAQVRPGVFGYLVSSSLGQAGEFCHLFDCTPRALTVPDGDTLTFRVNTELRSPFAILIAPTASQCLRIPGIENALVLDPSLAFLFTGVVSQPSPVLACWSGFDTVSARPPRGLSGVSFATQAVAFVPTLSSRSAPAFSVAVVTTIR
jgi:hypothetical protein